MPSDPTKSLDAEDVTLIQELVRYYEENVTWCERFLNSVEDLILTAPELRDVVHSTRKRVKDPGHLAKKLARKWPKYKAKAICKDNLFELVTDLAGFRIMHLHTDQIGLIHKTLLKLFEGAGYELVQDPEANIWDDEFQAFFENARIKTNVNPRMYMSVHYTIKSTSRIKVTCEIQVRTLADELWGEVDHLVNYPEESKSQSCRDQIRVLARVASSCSRLVDSIMRSHRELQEEELKASRQPAAKPPEEHQQ